MRGTVAVEIPVKSESYRDHASPRTPRGPLDPGAYTPDGWFTFIDGRTCRDRWRPIRALTSIPRASLPALLAAEAVPDQQATRFFSLIQPAPRHLRQPTHTARRMTARQHGPPSSVTFRLRSASTTTGTQIARVNRQSGEPRVSGDADNRASARATRWAATAEIRDITQRCRVGAIHLMHLNGTSVTGLHSTSDAVAIDSFMELL